MNYTDRMESQTVTTARQQGLNLFRQMMPELVPEGDDVELRDGGFADELGKIGLENLFARLWGRDGLGLRDRSLITVAILIATRAEDELRLHFQIALRNGVTRTELEELIYHSSGYLGYPAAAAARRLAREVFDDTTVGRAAPNGAKARGAHDGT